MTFRHIRLVSQKGQKVKSGYKEEEKAFKRWNDKSKRNTGLEDRA